MATTNFWRRLLLPGLTGVVASVTSAIFAVSFTDNFDVAHDYLAQGAAGTIWDGFYTGYGSFPGQNAGTGGLGSTLIANANITGAGRFTVQSVSTGWENTIDDGFFLFKNVAGDFQMSVHVVTPFAATPYNMAGLMVRAAEPNGAPWNGAENYVSLTRFDQFGIGNYVRNTVNGVTAQNTQPSDANYWLRIDRVNGTTFNFYSKVLASDPWQLISNAPFSGRTWPA